MRFAAFDIFTDFDGEFAHFAFGVVDYGAGPRSFCDFASFFAELARVETIAYARNLDVCGPALIYRLEKMGREFVWANPGPGEFSGLASPDGRFLRVFCDGVEFRSLQSRMPTRLFDDGVSALDVYADCPALSDCEEWVAKTFDLCERAGVAANPQPLTYSTLSWRNAEKTFDKAAFPYISPDVAHFLSQAILPGVTHVSRRAHMETGPGSVWDAVSMYPAIMREKRLPYGRPREHFGPPPEDKLWIGQVRAFGRVKPGKIPCVCARNDRGRPTPMLDDIMAEDVFIWTSVDVENFLENYDGKILYFGKGFLFDSATGVLGRYIDDLFDIKRNFSGPLATSAKLSLNSIFGKTGQGQDLFSAALRTHDDMFCPNKYSEDDVAAEYREPIAPQYCAFVAAYGRGIIARAAAHNTHRLIYVDTDGIHLSGCDLPDGVDVGSDLGQFDCEVMYDNAFYCGVREYVYEIGGVQTAKISGLSCPKELEPGINDVMNFPVFSSWSFATVPGGTRLINRPFQVSY